MFGFRLKYNLHFFFFRYFRYRIVRKEIDQYPESKKADWEAKKSGSVKRMILRVDKQKKLENVILYFDKSAKRQVNIKGRGTGIIKGAGDGILHRPYSPSQAVRTRPLKKNNNNLFTSGPLFTYFGSWK